MDLGDGLGHLTYSTLVHPGDTWDEMWASLDDVRAAGEGARLARRAVRRLAAAVGRLGGDARGRRGGARPPQGVPRRRTTSTSTPSTPSRTGRSRARGQGAGLRAGLADTEERTRVHDQRRRHPGRARARGHAAVDPDARRSASSRTSPDRTSSRGTRSTSCASSRTSSNSSAHRRDRDAGDRARAALLPRDDRRDHRLFHGAPLLGRRRDDGSRSSPASPIARRTRRCAGTSASCSTSATRRSGSRTSRLAAEAGRCRHPDLQAAGSGRDAHPAR